MKILFYMRNNKNLGFQIQMVLKTIGRLLYFMIFFGFSLLCYTQMCIILRVDYDGDDYKNVKNIFTVFLQTYRNSLGDLVAPSHQSWIDDGIYTDDELEKMTTIMWVVWTSSTLLNQIILMNFLIAAVSEAYEEVIGVQRIHKLEF